MLSKLKAYFKALEARRTAAPAKGPFTLAPGRYVMFNNGEDSFGQALFYIARAGSDAKGYSVAPWEADDIAREVVAALNATYAKRMKESGQ